MIRDKFEPALDASIVRLQNVMEGLCHDLKKQEGKRDANAGAAAVEAATWGFCNMQVTTTPFMPHVQWQPAAGLV